MNKYASFSKTKEARQQHYAYRSCHRKHRFSSEAEARHDWHGAVYHCRVCNGFHHTHRSLYAGRTD